jgi:hypothetical protein
MYVFRLNAEKVAYGILGCLLLLLIFKKAAQIPVTHDEVNTIELSYRSVRDIVSYADPVPNNHILNTLLMKAGHAIYGDRLLMSRFHNVLSFIPFYFFILFMGRLLFTETWLRFAWISVMLLQPYLLDFFSVTRGYGLSVAFEMVSLYYLFKRLDSDETKHLFYALFWAGVGVYANFTLLNYFIPLGFVLLIHSLKIHKRMTSSGFLKEFLLMFITAAILGGISIVPFIRMASTGQFVFWGNQGFFTDTIIPLISSCRVGVPYFKWSNEVIAYLITGGISTVLVMALWIGKKNFWTNRLSVAVSLLGLVLLYNHLQFWLANVPFLNARTALFLMPLVLLVLTLGIQTLFQHKPALGLCMSLFIGLLSVQHFIRGYNGTSCYEWYYDADTHAVLHEIIKIKENEHIQSPVSVNCHWIFYPSLHYHINHDYPGQIELVPYHKEVQPESNTIFYYTQSDEEEALKARFGVIQRYGWGSRLLLRHL